MSEPTDPTIQRADERTAEREVQRLLEEAGPRPEVSQKDLATIKTAFRAEWVRHTGAVSGAERTDTNGGTQPDRPAPLRLERDRPRPTRRVAFGPLLAAAAAVVLTAGLGWWWWQHSATTPMAGPAVARVEARQGQVLIRSAAVRSGADPAPWSVLPADGRIPLGAELQTSPGASELRGSLALRLGPAPKPGSVSEDGPSLRLDAGSRARIVSASVIELREGALYVDTGPAPGDEAGTGGESEHRPAVEIRTPFGVATDIGTRFEVRLLGGDAGPDALRVRVREGEVLVEQSGISESAGLGEELTLHADGTLDRSPIDTWGAEWEWVQQTAPPFDIEGRTLRELLGWVARETGWRIRYGDPELAQRADTIVLHGSMGGVTPDQAPDVVLPGAGLSARTVDGTLVVAPRVTTE